MNLKYKSSCFLNQTRILVLLLNTFFILGGCRKFVELSPPENQLINANVFNTDATATSAILGIYSRMVSSSGFAGGGSNSVTILTGLSADELINYSALKDRIEFANNTITPTNGSLTSLWAEPFQYIYTANSAIEGLNSSTGVSNAVKMQLLGEAQFIRAFCYFYLVNLYGDVPLYLSTDYKNNSLAFRSPKSEIFGLIISDLKEAQSLLSNDYSYSKNERIRPNKWAATALLARTYLFTKDWANAEVQASSIINNISLYDLPSDLNNVFKKNSSEAIWQILPVRSGVNTNEGQEFILTAPPSFQALTSYIINSFEANDARKLNWVGVYTSGTNSWFYPNKYKVKTSTTVTEYSMVLRLAEQFLIRAEARAKLNNLTGAKTDLNVIRTRSGLPNTTADDLSTILTAIEHERQVELFTEWGHRWIDLQRTGNANVILAPVKGSNWQSTDVLYPIPQIERNNNQNINQNTGY